MIFRAAGFQVRAESLERRFGCSDLMSDDRRQISNFASGRISLNLQRARSCFYEPPTRTALIIISVNRTRRARLISDDFQRWKERREASLQPAVSRFFFRNVDAKTRRGDGLDGSLARTIDR